jgi:chaperonin GroEL
VHAAQDAREEGVVPGGGVTLIRAIEWVNQLKLEGDEAFGAKALAKALEAPLRQLAENSGHDPSVIVEEVKAMKDANGYNFATGKVEDLFKDGVVDATLVARSALENAVSVASVLLTSRTLVTDLKDKKSKIQGSVR